MSEPRAPIRAIAYVRVSTRGQAERGMGLAAQRERVQKFARAKGWELIDTVEEVGSGGVLPSEDFSWEHRPALLDLVERAKAGECDALLVAKLDRLSRDHATLTVLVRRLQRAGVEVVSATEENGDGPMAEFMRGQLALIAQLERATILERVSAGKAQKKRQGKHVHGRVPFGFSSKDEPGTLKPVPDLIAVVRRIFEEARQGDSPGKIARRLERDGIAPPTRAGRWSGTTVHRIISNPAYGGERHGVKQAHPPLVSRQLFNAAQQALEQRAEAWAAKRGPR
jgi:site-specific DNA recombinase